MTEALDELMKSLEADLSIPPGFFGRLVQLDDWSFVIQSHALIETLLSECLAEHLKPTVRRSLATLNMRTKMSFVEEVGLLDKTDIRFIDALSKIRNYFAHNVKNVSATLKDYIDSLSPDALAGFRKACWTHFAGIFPHKDPKTLEPFYMRALLSGPKLWLFFQIGFLVRQLDEHRESGKKGEGVRISFKTALAALGGLPRTPPEKKPN